MSDQYRDPDSQAAYSTRRSDNDNDVMVVDAGDRKPSYGLGSLLALIAALAIAVSTFLSWAKQGAPRIAEQAEQSAADVPLTFLWDTDAALNDPSLLFVLLPAAILVLLGTFVPRLRWVAILGGAVAIATAVLFTIQVGQALPGDSPDGAFDFIDIGVWVAAAGGLLAIIGSLMIPRRPAEFR